MAKLRHTVFTLNNYTDRDIDDLKNWDRHSYLVFGKEVAPSTGTPHLQGYIEFKNQILFTTIKKKFPNIHVEKRKGTPKEASDYCKKEDPNFYECGELSQQGERKDLKEITSNILEGKTTVDDITINNPIMFHQYGRTLQKIEDIAMRRKFRTEMTKGIWYHGPTGAGKSHKAFLHYDPLTHYVYPNDNGWWDGYTGQHTVIINDFRGELPYNQLLQMVDKFPFSVKRRNREPMPFTSSVVIITSSLSPSQIYWRRVEEDSINQLLRRFEIFEILPQKCSEGNTKTSEAQQNIGEIVMGLSANNLENNLGTNDHVMDPDLENFLNINHN